MQAVPLNFIRGRKARVDEQPRQPKPDWLKVRAPGSENYLRLKGIMRSLGLHTVCEEANCPNIGECWHHGTATFMILGDTCTRSCGYCNVTHGRPKPPDEREPVNVASAVHAMALAHVVITSVDRDDLGDFGAAHFARTIAETYGCFAFHSGLLRNGVPGPEDDHPAHGEFPKQVAGVEAVLAGSVHGH